VGELPVPAEAAVVVAGAEAEGLAGGAGEAPAAALRAPAGLDGGTEAGGEIVGTAGAAVTRGAAAARALAQLARL
jgi:hypothetical protein